MDETDMQSAVTTLSVPRQNDNYHIGATTIDRVSKVPGLDFTPGFAIY